MADRPAIPEALKREVLVESEHRCAICREPAYDIAHIEPWSKVKEHTFDNLIALCPNCHRRTHTSGDIDRASLRRYKANLSIIKSRYSDFERRVLEAFAGPPRSNAIDLAGKDFELMHLLRDGLIVDTGAPIIDGVMRRAVIGGVEMSPKRYVLTDKGEEFVQRWLGGEPLA